MDELKDLELLIQSRHPIVVAETYEDERLEEGLTQIAMKLGLPFFVWTITEGLRRRGVSQPVYDTKAPLKALGNLAAIENEGVYLFKDLHRHLEDPEVLGKLKEIERRFSKSRRTLVLSAPPIDLPPELEKRVAVFKLALPSEKELKLLARKLLKDLSREHRFQVQLSPADFERLIEGMKGFTLVEAERALTRAVLSDLALTLEDLDLIIKIKKELLEKEGILEYVPPKETISQVGGLKKLKAWLQKRKKAFSPDAKRFGLAAPRGILLLGVPGCGKSLVAKAVATDWGLPLLRFDPGRLYNKFVGESEKNLEKALHMAERMAPCVLLIDEVEKALASGGSSDADAGLSQRVLARLLSWLQDREEPVFVVATCNEVSKLPPESMRKGRFDEVFFIDLPSLEERGEIYAAHLQRRGRNPEGFDLDALARSSEGFSGAEIEQSLVSALYTAYSQGVHLSAPLILEELRLTRPLSVTRAEEIGALRDWAPGRAVMAS